MHLKVKNGTNLALMNALLYELITNGWYDEEYVNTNTIGFEGLKKHSHKVHARDGRGDLRGGG